MLRLASSKTVQRSCGSLSQSQRKIHLLANAYSSSRAVSSLTRQYLTRKSEAHQGRLYNASQVLVLSPVRSFSSHSEKEKKDEANSNTALTTPNNNKQHVVIRGLKAAYISTRDSVMNPRATWQWIKEGAHHYWVGSKLLWSEIKITRKILGRVLQGHEMTRRERRQLIRTTTDMFRLVPFAIFVIVPFMELLLPLALKLFPNMLPSTFEDSLKKEEQLKKELQMRLAVAKFMQETLQTIADKKAMQGGGVVAGSGGEGSAAEILDFVEKARKGEPISNDKVIMIAKMFKDELTLPNIARPQLVSMCKYMGLQTYGSDDFLRFQLRTKFRAIKEDDRRILWEGIDSLNTLELREACRERGMRSIGITQFRLKNQLQEWLQLSTTKNIPISLLIMSRAFSLTTSDEPEEVLKSSMSSLDSDTINEVVVASASVGEEKTIELQKRKLESLKFQEELIEEEIEYKDLNKKKQAAAAASIAEKGKEKDKEKESNAASASISSATNSSTSPANPTSSTASSSSSTLSSQATSSPATEGKTLTLQEIQALSDLARGSSLHREKSELQVLQSMIEALLVHTNHPEKLPSHASPSPTSPTSPVSPSSRDDEINKSLSLLRTALSSMLDKLQSRMESSEKALGDKFNVLDQDGDGELSAEELREAIVKLLRGNYSHQEAEALVNDLDDNKDGKISLAELLLYIQRKKERLEASLPIDANDDNHGSSSSSSSNGGGKSTTATATATSNKTST